MTTSGSSAGTTPREEGHDVSPEESLQAFLGNPNRHSVRNSNSIILRHTLAMTDSDEDEEDGRIMDEQDPDAASKKKKKKCCTSFCGLMDDHFTVFILGAAAIGFGIGIGLSYWTPEDDADKTTALLWVGLIGDLFIRALKCIVLPLVFVSIAVSVMDMVSSVICVRMVIFRWYMCTRSCHLMHALKLRPHYTHWKLSLGEAGSIAWTTIGLYVCTTICAAIIGSIVSVLFSNVYTLVDTEGESLDPNVKIGCAVDEFGDPQSYLTQQADGSVLCEANNISGNNTIFSLEDLNGYFQKSPQAEGPAKFTLSESLYQGKSQLFAYMWLR